MKPLVTEDLSAIEMTGPSKSSNNNQRGKKFSNNRFTHKPKPLNAQEAVPILTFGPTNNWIDFAKKMATAACHRFGHLGDLVEQKTYYLPPSPKPDMTIPDLTQRDKVLDHEYRERSKTINQLEREKPMLYAFVISKLSLESEDEIKRHKDYVDFNQKKDPLALWLALEELHLTSTISKNAAFVLAQAEQDYMTLQQGEHELITKFKERFDHKLNAYNNALGIGNHITEERAAMTFLIKLCRANYSQFYATQINEINADASKAPKTVNEVYIKAKAFVVSTTQNKPNGTPVSFATTADNLIRNNNKKNTPKNGPGANPTNNHTSSQPSTTKNQPTANVAPTTVEPATANSNAPSATGSNTKRDLSRVQCYHCQLFGHYARECPSK